MRHTEGDYLYAENVTAVNNKTGNKLNGPWFKVRSQMGNWRRVAGLWTIIVPPKRKD